VAVVGDGGGVGDLRYARGERGVNLYDERDAAAISGGQAAERVRVGRPVPGPPDGTGECGVLRHRLGEDDAGGALVAGVGVGEGVDERVARRDGRAAVALGEREVGRGADGIDILRCDRRRLAGRAGGDGVGEGVHSGGQGVVHGGDDEAGGVSPVAGEGERGPDDDAAAGRGFRPAVGGGDEGRVQRQRVGDQDGRGVPVAGVGEGDEVAQRFAGPGQRAMVVLADGEDGRGVNGRRRAVGVVVRGGVRAVVAVVGDRRGVRNYCYAAGSGLMTVTAKVMLAPVSPAARSPML
jgi:hypothetical protein